MKTQITYVRLSRKMAMAVLSLFSLISATSLSAQSVTKSAYSKQSDADKRPVVLAYVTAWSKGLPDPTVLTHINYAFGHVNKTFNGVTVANPERLKSITALKKQYPALKVSLSIGGWGSGGFSEMAASVSNRKAFAADCAQKIDSFGLDGIDIDWEYPTSSSAGISASPEDKNNFTLLMQDIRLAIGSKSLLTLASVASADFIDFKAIVRTVDFVNIMAYDMERPPHHHSGLYRSSHSGRTTVDEAVKAHLKAGMPADKLVLGIPFYGHGTGPVRGYIDYKDIRQLKGFNEMWDDTAKAPYLTDSTGKFVCTYENPASIAIKCAYIDSCGLKGAMYWDYSADSPDGILRTTVYHQLMDKRSSKGPSFSVLGLFSANFDKAHISFAHEANQWLYQQSLRYHFRYDATQNWEILNDPAALSKYQAVLFLDNVAPENTHEGFERYMKSGGGFMGFHVSAFNDQPKTWDWNFNQFLGCGLYKGNTWRPTAATLKVDDTKHPVTAMLAKKFNSAPNEWYKWEKNLRHNPDIDVLLSIDSSSFPLGTGPKTFEIWHGGDYPVVWTNKKYRMLYINMGHNDMDYEHKYGPHDSTLSHTFSSEGACRLLLNALFWLGGQKSAPAGTVETDLPTAHG